MQLGRRACNVGLPQREGQSEDRKGQRDSGRRVVGRGREVRPVSLSEAGQRDLSGACLGGSCSRCPPEGTKAQLTGAGVAEGSEQKWVWRSQREPLRLSKVVPPVPETGGPTCC